jgi:hypothetical protein
VNAPAPGSNVVPINEGARWEHVSIRVAPDRPRIDPREYYAKSVGLRKYKAFERTIVELQFDVYAAEPGSSAIVARLPMYASLPKHNGALSPNSRLAGMLRMLGQVRRDRVQPRDLDVLRDKLWRVAVDDTKRDNAGELTDTEIPPYSVIRRVLGRA